MVEFEFLRSVPVVPAPDLDASMAYYRDVLGFAVAFQVPNYSGVVRGPIEIHLDSGAPEIGRASCRERV